MFIITWDVQWTFISSTSQQECTVALQKGKAGSKNSKLSDGNLKAPSFGLKFILEGRTVDIADPQKYTDGRDLYLIWHTGQELKTKPKHSPLGNKYVKKHLISFSS